MRALLDAHTFLWWITDDPKLSSQARKVIGDSRNEIFLSAATGWEIAIKAQLGRLHLPEKPELFISKQMIINSIQGLPIQISHAINVYNLPNHHQDPFDRMLVSQALLEGLTIITADPQIAKYKAKTIW